MKKSLVFTKDEAYRDGLTLGELSEFVADAEAIGISLHTEPKVVIRSPRGVGVNTGTGFVFKISVEKRT